MLNQLESLTKALSEAPVPHAGIFGYISKLIGWRSTKSKDIPTLKKAMADQLRKEQKQILVVIDDIDRLTSEEIRQLFRTVKVIADFPYITYLMAFEKRIVTTALKEFQGMPGEEYLEKIVQAPFELPLPDKLALRGLLTEQLDRIHEGTPEGLFEVGHWSMVYFEGIDKYIKTPRDVVRLVNTLSVTYPPVHGEVNPVDYFAIETLRVFEPEVFDIIRRNPSFFTGRPGSSVHGTRRIDDLRAFHDGWLKQHATEDREHIRKFLRHLFPGLDMVWGNMSWAASNEAEWRKALRVCSPDIFPAYFSMSVPEGSISNTEMQAFLALSANEQAFADKLLEIATQIRPDGTTRVRPFLERLQDYTSTTVTVEQARSIITSLLLIGDRLIKPEDEPTQMFEFGTDMYISRVIYQLLLRLDEEERFDLFHAAIQKSESLSTVVSEVSLLERSSEREAKPGGELISEAHEASLKAQALLKIQDAAKDGTLKFAQGLLLLLHRWKEWGEIKEARAWVRQNTESDDELVEFLEKTKNKTITTGGGDAFTRVSYRIDLSQIGPFFDVEELMSRASNIIDTKEDISTEMRGMLVRLIERKGGERDDGEIEAN